MSRAFEHMHFRWPAGSSTPDFLFHPGEEDTLDMPQGIPPELGHGTFDLLHLSLGMSFFRATQTLDPSTRGRLIQMNEVTVDYGAPSFMVQTIRGGRILHVEGPPPVYLFFEDGLDLFCHVRRREIVPRIEGGTHTEMVSLCMQLQTLANLVGEPEVDFLLKSLNVSSLPSLMPHPMPRALSARLHAALVPTFTGASRRLFAQARALDYLTALVEHLRGVAPVDTVQPPMKRKVAELREELLALKGRVPTLEALAERYGIPARRLNAAFQEAFGQSIYTFITGQRLEQARQALLETEVPMKVLADHLGYSHVNHFITAFRRRFGQSPGRLRRKP